MITVMAIWQSKDAPTTAKQGAKPRFWLIRVTKYEKPLCLAVQEFSMEWLSDGRDHLPFRNHA